MAFAVVDAHLLAFFVTPPPALELTVAPALGSRYNTVDDRIGLLLDRRCVAALRAMWISGFLFVFVVAGAVASLRCSPCTSHALQKNWLGTVFLRRRTPHS
jgi:hypothetical protein